MWLSICRSPGASFALPGNPVFVMVCLYRDLPPALQVAMSGKKLRRERAGPSREYRFTPDPTCFLPVRMRYDK